MNADEAQMNVKQIRRVNSVLEDPWARITSKGFGVRSSALHLRSSAFSRLLGCLALALSSFPATAEVTATDAWVRGTVPAQTSTGAFMTLHSTQKARVVGISSPAAKGVEIHASEMHGGVMHMSALDALPLPAGKRVELKPGGYHIMLTGLARPLAAGDTVALTLVIEAAKGARQTLEVKAVVRPIGK
jgi:copper(I)-binding protein